MIDTDDKSEESESSDHCDATEKMIDACEAYGNVSPIVSRSAGKAAMKAMELLAKDSSIFSVDDCHKIPKLDSNDLHIGRLLGKGGFSEVHEVTYLSRSKRANDEGENGSCDDEEETKKHAIKFLKLSVMVDRTKFPRGAADLAIESRFLSVIDHPNIVKLHGVTAGSVSSNVAAGNECGFFIVIDRLYGTLVGRIQHWKQISGIKNGILSRARRNLKKDSLLLQERLSVASSLAEAIRYLHSMNIVYRDLKPENVGFDAMGVLKLFDFGLSKELKERNRVSEDTYDLTGNSGSLRYMAPEVAFDKPYSLSVDAYSFGILLWEMCTLEKAFMGYSSAKHRDAVVKGGDRPKIDGNGIQACWPTELEKLIENCWAEDMHKRPTFDQITSTLKSIQDVGSINFRKLALPQRKRGGSLESSGDGMFKMFSLPQRKRGATTGSHPVH